MCLMPCIYVEQNAENHVCKSLILDTYYKLCKTWGHHLSFLITSSFCRIFTVENSKICSFYVLFLNQKKRKREIDRSFIDPEFLKFPAKLNEF